MKLGRYFSSMGEGALLRGRNGVSPVDDDQILLRHSGGGEFSHGLQDLRNAIVRTHRPATRQRPTTDLSSWIRRRLPTLISGRSAHKERGIRRCDSGKPSARTGYRCGKRSRPWTSQVFPSLRSTADASSVYKVEVPCAVDSDKEGRPLVSGPSFMDHLRWHVGIGTRVQRHLLITAVMLHGEGAAEDGERLIRRMPVSRHMEVLRCPYDEFRGFRDRIHMQNGDVLQAVRSLLPF